MERIRGRLHGDFRAGFWVGGGGGAWVSDPPVPLGLRLLSTLDFEERRAPLILAADGFIGFWLKIGPDGHDFKVLWKSMQMTERSFYITYYQ